MLTDAVRVSLVLLPVGSIFSADKEGELAQEKGEVLALEGAITINYKKCYKKKTPPLPCFLDIKWKKNSYSYIIHQVDYSIENIEYIKIKNHT